MWTVADATSEGTVDDATSKGRAVADATLGRRGRDHLGLLPRETVGTQRMGPSLNKSTDVDTERSGPACVTPYTLELRSLIKKQ